MHNIEGLNALVKICIHRILKQKQIRKQGDFIMKCDGKKKTKKPWNIGLSVI